MEYKHWLTDDLFLTFTLWCLCTVSENLLRPIQKLKWKLHTITHKTRASFVPKLLCLFGCIQTVHTEYDKCLEEPGNEGCIYKRLSNRISFISALLVSPPSSSSCKTSGSLGMRLYRPKTAYSSSPRQVGPSFLDFMCDKSLGRSLGTKALDRFYVHWSVTESYTQSTHEPCHIG